MFTHTLLYHCHHILAHTYTHVITCSKHTTDFNSEATKNYRVLAFH